MNKTIKALALLASAILMGVSAPVMAQTAAATPAGPTITVNGLVDAYITYNFNDGADSVGNVDQFWNTTNNQFSLGLAETKITATQGGATGVVELAYQGDGNNNLGLPNGNLDVLQAYASYATNGFTFTAGRFATWIGYEVIEPTGNPNYSHSLAFWYTIPIWNQGLSVNYTTSDSVLSATAYATDGWNSTFHSDYGFTYGGQVVFAPSSDWKFIANGIDGPGVDAFWNNGKYDRWVAELIASYSGVKNLSLGLDATYGGDDLGTSFGYPFNGNLPLININSFDIWDVALYGKYAITSDWSAALRVENLTDLESFFGVYGTTGTVPGNFTNSLQEVTLTVNHSITPQWSVLAEGRYDTEVMNGKTPTAGNGPYFEGATNQVTATVASEFAF